MLKEHTPESPEEKLRIEFQTELQNTVHRFATAGVEPPVVLQEVARLVGDVLYRIAFANNWLHDTDRLSMLAAMASSEIAFTFQTLKKANPEAQNPNKTPNEEHTVLH